jgi:DNA replication protein DnaC
MSPARRGVTDQAADAAIDQACRLLRLPTIRDRFAELADAAKRQQLTYRGFLAELLMAECDDRDRRRSARRVKEAGLPRPKSLEEFDFDANPAISAATIHTLASCGWIRNREPLCLIGDPGTGKSHLLIGPGTIAAQQGYRVRYTLAAKLVNELVEAADERHLAKTIARYGRVDLLCIDELGHMELDRRGAELLFQVLTEREEQNSVAIASNESFGGWTKTFTDPGCARRSWTDSPSAATSSRPAPTPTGWPTPAGNAPPPPTPGPDPAQGGARADRHTAAKIPLKWGQVKPSRWGHCKLTSPLWTTSSATSSSGPGAWASPTCAAACRPRWMTAGASPSSPPISTPPRR